jgi:DNA modification methylase
MSAHRSSIEAILFPGDSLQTLKDMPSESVHCCITSPPYYRLRDYGFKGQIGQEESPEKYIKRLVVVFREVRRVLRNDGTLWVNIGDKYATGSAGRGTKSKKQQGNRGTNTTARKPERSGGLKPKDLIGIPWMLAFALRKDGWYLRQEIIWHKPCGMPESVTDRPTKAHEQIFLLSKSEKYFYNADAIAEPAKYAGKTRSMGPKSVGNSDRNDGGRTLVIGKTKNKRSVWLISPHSKRSSQSSHYATFPVLIPEICLLAGCPEGGIVLDPFSGSGTTGEAALNNKRKYSGVERSLEYLNISAARIVHEGHTVLYMCG